MPFVVHGFFFEQKQLCFQELICLVKFKLRIIPSISALLSFFPLTFAFAFRHQLIIRHLCPPRPRFRIRFHLLAQNPLDLVSRLLIICTCRTCYETYIFHGKYWRYETIEGRKRQTQTSTPSKRWKERPSPSPQPISPLRNRKVKDFWFSVLDADISRTFLCPHYA